MVPNPDYFPTNLAKQRAWFSPFNSNMQTVGPSLGFTAAELLELAQDWETFDVIAVAMETIDKYSSAARAYRRILFEGGVGETAPAWPADIAFSLPFDRPTGIFERLTAMVKRIRVSPNYTEEIGALLGIIPAETAPETIGEDTAPKIDALVFPFNRIDVKFVRGGRTGIYLEAQYDNQTTWEKLGRFNRSPARLTVPPADGDLPRLVKLRAMFIDGNDPVGDFCDVVYVQTVP